MIPSTCRLAEPSTSPGVHSVGKRSGGRAGMVAEARIFGPATARVLTLPGEAIAVPIESVALQVELACDRKHEVDAVRADAVLRRFGSNAMRAQEASDTHFQP